MKLNFLVPCAYEVIDDVGRGSVSPCATEPFITRQALYDACSVVDPTVSDVLLALSVQLSFLLPKPLTRKHVVAIQLLPLASHRDDRDCRSEAG